MSLKEKKVLVISPFADLIENQYKNRRRLFPSNELFLPDFDLKTLKAVDTAGENWKYSGYQTWTDALIAMEEQIKKIDFDIALIGCGAYAFPLGAFCKTMGKKAITTCGATSLYFGIYGNRWKHLPEINQFWIRPNRKYNPIGFEKIENGAYW